MWSVNICFLKHKDAIIIEDCSVKLLGKNGHELIEFLQPHLPVVAEDNFEKPQAVRRCAETDLKRALPNTNHIVNECIFRQI